MTPSARIARHLRAHIVGYLALFVALGGTAVALPGKNKVDSNDLRRGAVKSKAIKDAAVTNAKLADNAVSSSKIADGSVIGLDLGNGVVTDAKIADNAVTRSKIPVDAINAARLANSSVNSGKVENSTLQAQDFAPGQLSEGFVQDLPATSAPFTLPRTGKLFVVVTFTSDCPVANCTYNVTVDGASVPGTAVTGNLDQQVTLTGVTGPLAAGERTVAIVTTNGATVTDPTIAAVLLQ